MLKKILFSALILGLGACAGDEENVDDPMAPGAEGSASVSPGMPGAVDSSNAMGGQEAAMGGAMGQAGAAAGQPSSQPGQSGIVPNKHETFKLQKVTVLNVRSGPGVKFPVVRTIKKGEMVQAYGKKSFWLKISKDGKQWVSGRYVTFMPEMSPPQ